MVDFNFTVTVSELKGFLADKPDDARVIITPINGESFGVQGWCAGVRPDGTSCVILTGGSSA